MKNKIKLPNLVIPIGGVNSNVYSPSQIRFVASISFEAPATLPETVNIQTSADGVTWTTFQSPPGTDVVLAAGKSIEILDSAFRYVRLLSGITAAERTFQATGAEEF